MRLAFIAGSCIGLVSFGLLLQFNQHQSQSLRLKIQSLEKQLAIERANYQTLYYEWLRERNLNRASEPGQDQSAHRRQAQLTIEKQSLESLKSQLAAAKNQLGDSEASAAAAAHVNEASANITKLQGLLAKLRDDSQSISDNSKRYQQGVVQGESQTLAALRSQNENVRAAITNLKSEIEQTKRLPKSPDRAGKLRDLHQQMETLKGQQRQLNTQIQATQRAEKQTANSIHQEVKSEQAEVQAERADLERQLTLAKADLDHWGKISKGIKAHSASSDKINLIQTQIDAQEQKIKQLQEQPDAAANSDR